MLKKHKNIMKKIALVSSIFLAPLFLFAADSTTAETLIGKLQAWVEALVPIVMTLALLYFFYGLATYIMNAGDESKAKEGKSIMIYGIIALFVMISVWGLVGFLQRTFGVTESISPTVPTIQVD
ncbi:MAG: Uncharacterized protein Athens071416_66 [Parcubacteria group bacterium Athens0714_16]|nr:MAG: Uncharacterized protein Athens071416_66 [Parcubacteria group bacterium Athens0714_16]